MLNLNVTCMLHQCNLITSLFPQPVCSRGTNRLEMRLLDYICACTAISKKQILYRSMPGKKKNPLFFLPDMGLSLKISAIGIPLHAYVFSFTHMQWFFHSSDVFTLKIRRQYFDFRVLMNQNKCRLHKI